MSKVTHEEGHRRESWILFPIFLSEVELVLPVKINFSHDSDSKKTTQISQPELVTEWSETHEICISLPISCAGGPAESRDTKGCYLLFKTWKDNSQNTRSLHFH